MSPRVSGSARGTLILSALVLATACMALLPGGRPALPGTIRMAVIAGHGGAEIRSALGPLATLLGQSLRRTVQLETVTAGQMRSREGGLDLALLPEPLARAWPGAEVLAWARFQGVTGAGSRPMALYPVGRRWNELASPRLIYGDSLSWGGGEGARGYLQDHGFGEKSRFSKVAWGHDLFDHMEAIGALVHGAFDLAIVRDADLQRALDAGVVDRRDFVIDRAGPQRQDLALVAAPTLPKDARRSVREAALALDHARFDPANLRAQLAQQGMECLGLAGFAPKEPWNGLRP